jgi:hypothetical protein
MVSDCGCKVKQTKFFVLISILLFTLQYCNTIEPPGEDTPGRRDYVWTVDTLMVPEGRSVPSWMWGANENDIWAVGASYTNAYAIWHYDGNRWTNYVPDQYIDPRGLWGTSSSNIWTGSTDGALWHYDGIKWSKNTTVVIPNYQQFVIQSIAGSAPNNIYAVGFADSNDGSTYKGIIVHYNGSEWKHVNIPSTKNSFVNIVYDNLTGHFIFRGWIFDKPDEYVYTFDGVNLKIIYHTIDGIGLSSIGKNIYATSNNKIYKLSSDNIEVFKDFSSTNYAGGTWGKSEVDFFTFNWDGIGHYNGTNLTTIFQKWNNEWSPDGAIVFEKSVFFIWDDSFNTFIVHGKLRD